MKTGRNVVFNVTKRVTNTVHNVTVCILYFQKQNKDGSTLWQCSVRNKKTTCLATVNHRGDSFTTNNKPPTHESILGILTNVLITKKIIETAKADIFTMLWESEGISMLSWLWLFDVIMIMIIKRWNANTIYQPYCLIQSTCMEIKIKSISQL